VDDIPYLVERPLRTDSEFDVGLSVRIATINEDVLSIELDRAGPRYGVDLIQEVRETARDIANRQAGANGRD
jgi:hypothetical protein